MNLIKLFTTLKNKIWELIENKYLSDSSKAYKILSGYLQN